MFHGQNVGINRAAKRWCLASTVMVFGLTLPIQAAQSANIDVGKTFKIRNVVSGSIGNRKLAVSDPVFGSESIRADANSHGEIILNDDSKIVVGENSEISLDDFVVAGDGFQSATLNVAKGAFRFISGESPKGTFTIKTPLSTIGVRGTVFDVYVGDGGVTSVVLLQGQVRVCTTNSKCLIAERSCDIIEVRSPDEIAEKPFLRSARRPAAEETAAFSLLSGQGRFEKRFRAQTANCNSRSAQEKADSGKSDGGNGLDQGRGIGQGSTD